MRTDREYERMGRAFERGRQQQRAKQGCYGCLFILALSVIAGVCMSTRNSGSSATPTPAPVVGAPSPPAATTPRVVVIGTPR